MTKIGATVACAAVAVSFPLRAEVVVGVAVPSSGIKTQQGYEIKSAAQAEVARINAAGGVSGEAVRLVLGDDDCTADGGRRLAETFAGQKALLVLGHPCSGAAIAAAKVYARTGTWFAAIGAGHPDLTARRAGAMVFRLTGNDGRQAADTAALLTERFKGQRVAVVHDRTAYARALAEGVRSGLARAGMPAGMLAGITAGEKQYAAVIARLKAENAGVIYFAGFPAERDILVHEIATLGLKIPLVANDAAARGNLTPLTGLATGENFFMAQPAAGRASRTADATRLALKALAQSGRQLDLFAAALDVQPDGDAKGPAFIPSGVECPHANCE